MTFAIQNNNIFLLEVNPRSSRTVPFVAKATGSPIVKIALSAAMGKPCLLYTSPSPRDS